MQFVFSFLVIFDKIFLRRVLSKDKKKFIYERLRLKTLLISKLANAQLKE